MFANSPGDTANLKQYYGLIRLKEVKMTKKYYVCPVLRNFGSIEAITRGTSTTGPLDVKGQAGFGHVGAPGQNPPGS